MKTWIKKYTSTYNGSSWLEAEASLPTPDYYRAVAINDRLLCLAGSVDADGSIVTESGTPLTVAHIARLLRLQTGDVQSAITDLLKFGILDQDEDGTYYYGNWGVYQTTTRSDDERRAYERDRKRAARAAKKAAAATPETPEADLDDAEGEINAEELAAAMEAEKERIKSLKAAERAEQAAREKAEQALFDEWWAMYPRKTDKANARKEWAKLAKNTNLRKVIVATRALLDCDAYEPLHADKAYIPYPSTWLHGRRFEDINDLQQGG